MLMRANSFANLAAPLQNKLIESNLVKDLGDTTGFTRIDSETSFSGSV